MARVTKAALAHRVVALVCDKCGARFDAEALLRPASDPDNQMGLGTFLLNKISLIHSSLPISC